MDEKAPTFNPFATETRRFVPAPVAPQEKPENKKQFPVPPYYLSQITVNFLRQSVETNAVTLEELPSIYDLALHVASVFGRTTPTKTDMELALTLRTKEHVEQIAKGEVEFDRVRNDQITMEMMPKPKRLQYWKMFATALMAEMTNTSPAS